MQQVLSHFEPVTLTGATLLLMVISDYLKREFGFTEEQVYNQEVKKSIPL